MNIYTIGHLTPDLDSISASISFAEFLTKIKKYPESSVEPVLPGELNNETKFVLSKFHITSPRKLEDVTLADTDKIVLIDHNEESQRHPLIKKEQIIGIVDHHKTNINFAEPIYINTRPLGSSSTLIYIMFQEQRIEPSTQTMQLMLTAILSDTVGFKSSTTTNKDKEVATELANKLQLNVEELTFEIFKAKSDLTGLTAEQIVTKDYKSFEMKGKKVLISQIETVEPEEVLKVKDALVTSMEQVKTQQGVDQMYMFLTDILNVKSTALYTNEFEKSILEKAFNTTAQNGVLLANKVISRKKDIVPAIENAQ